MAPSRWRVFDVPFVGFYESLDCFDEAVAGVGAGAELGGDVVGAQPLRVSHGRAAA